MQVCYLERKREQQTDCACVPSFLLCVCVRENVQVLHALVLFCWLIISILFFFFSCTQEVCIFVSLSVCNFVFFLSLSFLSMCFLTSEVSVCLSQSLHNLTMCVCVYFLLVMSVCVCLHLSLSLNAWASVCLFGFIVFNVVCASQKAPLFSMCINVYNGFSLSVRGVCLL